jgi:hypothetical protein
MREGGATPLRIMGLNNHYFLKALSGPTHEQMVAAGGQWAWWQKLAAEATQAPGYIFDAAKRSAWATIVKVHETGDIKWETDP